MRSAAFVAVLRGAADIVEPGLVPKLVGAAAAPWRALLGARAGVELAEGRGKRSLPMAAEHRAHAVEQQRAAYHAGRGRRRGAEER